MTVLTAQQRCLFLETHQERGDIHRFIVRARWRGLQSRKHEQIVHQALHAQGLLVHGGKMLLEVFHLDLVHLPQRLDITAEDRERRAQLVRNVGHEMAAHLFQPHQPGDIASDDEFLAAAERRDLDGDVDFAIVR